MGSVSYTHLDVYKRQGYENKVKQNLLQRAQTYNMLDNILHVEIPTQTVNVEKNGKVKEVEENRFPGYVLVEMVMTDEAWFLSLIHI